MLCRGTLALHRRGHAGVMQGTGLLRCVLVGCANPAIGKMPYFVKLCVITRRYFADIVQ